MTEQTRKDEICSICGMAHILENMDFIWIIHESLWEGEKSE